MNEHATPCLHSKWLRYHQTFKLLPPTYILSMITHYKLLQRTRVRRTHGKGKENGTVHKIVYSIVMCLSYLILLQSSKFVFFTLMALSVPFFKILFGIQSTTKVFISVSVTPMYPRFVHHQNVKSTAATTYTVSSSSRLKC